MPTHDVSAPAPGRLPGPAWFWRRRRPIEVAFWIAMTVTNAVANTVTVLMDIRRVGLRFADWEPAVWEWSSGVMILAMVPGLLAWTRRVPFHGTTRNGPTSCWGPAMLCETRSIASPR